jgi:two-component system nitrate/nitrite response regulator NarL
MTASLSSREQEITSLVSSGLSNKEVARRLKLTEGTIKVHLHHIFRKTRVSNRTALAALMNGYTLRGFV